MWIASARYALVFEFSSVMGPWLSLPKSVRGEIHVVVFCWTCVEQPSLSQSGNGGGTWAISSILGKSIDRNKSIFFNPEMTCPWWLKQHSVLMSELWFPYESIVSICSSSFHSFSQLRCVSFSCVCENPEVICQSFLKLDLVFLQLIFLLRKKCLVLHAKENYCKLGLVHF